MRTLTANTTAQKNAASTEPVNILKLEFGGAVGTKYYSDRPLGAGDASSWDNAEARVVSWGRIAALIQETKFSPIGDLSIVLQDGDKTLKGYLDTVEFQHKQATLYQWFSGLAEGDLLPIAVGMITAPLRWSETAATITLDITDISTLKRVTIGKLADRDTFPYVAQRDEGRTLPIVFGSVKRTLTIDCNNGAVTELVRPCQANDTTLFVNDASRFPQGESITIRIDKELIIGSFAGNTFTATQRGAALVTNQVTDKAIDANNFRDTSLSDNDDTYTGYYVKVTSPDDVVWHQEITWYSGELRQVHYYPAIYSGLNAWTIPAGTTYDITSYARAHQVGAIVRYSQPAYVYILNDAASKAVKYLEGYGRLRIPTEHAGQDKITYADQDTWIRINANFYTIDRNDTATIPGRTITSATFSRPPKELYPGLKDGSIWATMEGVEDAGDGTGALIENPALIIREFLQRDVWMGLPDSDLNTDSFSEAESELACLKMAFALDKQRDSLQLIADLAYQARSAMLWDDGKARLAVLSNKLGDSVATLNAAKVRMDSLVIARTNFERVASEVTARYQRQAEERQVVVRDAAVEAAYGRRVRALDLWAYNTPKYVEAIATFWLTRWKYIYTEVRVSAFLTALELQRNDTVTLDLPNFFDAGQKARILDVHHQPGMGEGGVIDDIALRLRVPQFAGCETTCEIACETGAETGCFLACEIEAESDCWQCETSCEAGCELYCTTECEMNCVVGDSGGGGGGCGACETACESACESACEGRCELICETAGCEICETGCETGCQGTCETGCELGCETLCQSAGCEAYCQTGCETACESDCTTWCESGCEVDCEIGCETACETGECETGCETSCETGECETACETACETGCQASCQVCQTGCETACEPSCEAGGCEAGCEASCQTGCELSCESGECETGCETGCESGCQTSCETGCQTTCETGCETSEEGGEPSECCWPCLGLLPGFGLTDEACFDGPGPPEECMYGDCWYDESGDTTEYWGGQGCGEEPPGEPYVLYYYAYDDCEPE